MNDGGYVTARSGFDGSEIKGLKTRVDRNSRGPASADYYGDSYGDNSSGDDRYIDPYEELYRDYGYDPTDLFGDGDSDYTPVSLYNYSYGSM